MSPKVKKRLIQGIVGILIAIGSYLGYEISVEETPEEPIQEQVEM